MSHNHVHRLVNNLYQFFIKQEHPKRFTFVIGVLFGLTNGLSNDKCEPNVDI